MPAHWEVRKIKSLARSDHKSFVDGDWIESPYITSDGIRLIQTGNIGIGEYREKGFRYISEETFRDFSCTEFLPGDVLICRLGEPVARACLAPRLGKRMITSVDVCILKSRDDINAQFVVYCMSSHQYLAWVGSLVRGSTRDRVSRSMLGAFPMPLPPLPEQRAIVRYLDHAARRIRRYVSAKRKLIALLEEEKQAIVSRAVTRGLDPNVRLKPSGVEWLGEVPEHWEVRRLKTLCSMRSGEAITAESIETTGEYPVYGGNGLRGYASNYTHDGAFALIGRQGALCGNVHIARDKFWASEHAVVASLQPGHVLEWFGAVLQTMNLNQYSIAAAQPGLAVERILNLWLPVPPPEEQETMAIRIGLQTADIDSAIVRARRQIELVQEYRTKLIADVVTGKLDVREAAAQLPDETDDQDPIGETARLVDGLPGDLYEIDESVEDSVMEEEVTA